MILEMTAELKLLGMRLAFDEVLANGVKRQHAAQQIVGDLLAAEIAEKHARSIRCQGGAAKLPLAQELADFDFAGSPINEGLVREWAPGSFLSQQRNTVLVGGAGTGKSRLAVAMARNCIRAGARCRFCTVIDLVNPRLFRNVTLRSGPMPRKPIGEKAMTDAGRQARCRAARATGAPAIRTRRPADHRSRARRWPDAVAGLTALQAQIRQHGWTPCPPTCRTAPSPRRCKG